MAVGSRIFVLLLASISLIVSTESLATIHRDDLVLQSQWRQQTTPRQQRWFHSASEHRKALLIRGGESNSLSMAAASSVDVGETNDRPASRAYSYYLLWSPGFVTKFLASSLVIGLFYWVFSDPTSPVGMIFTELFVRIPVIPNLVLPLLASSCCMIQLIINVVVGAGGCAGFNTALGPLRPFFLSLLAFMTYQSKPKLSLTLVRGVLALLPEFMHFLNEFVSSSRQNKTTTATLYSSNPSITATVLVDIPAMGCVACVNKIDSSLRDCAPQNIASAKTWLDPDKPKGGKTKINLVAQSEDELNDLKARIVQTIEAAGFGGSSIASVESTTLD